MYYFKAEKEILNFEEFKELLIYFLTRVHLKSIADYSLKEFMKKDYNKKRQEMEIKAINKILKELYGDGVQWIFIHYDETERNNDFGPHIVINNKKYILYPSYNYTFIKKRLK